MTLPEQDHHHEHEQDHHHECEHDHHHEREHDHHHECEHDHHHECEHDHHHECEHDHHHECEHDHHHDHHHEHSHHHDESSSPIEITHHDEALVGTLRLELPVSYDMGKEKLQKELSQLAQEIEEAGGLIGHMKAWIRDEHQSAMISVTAADQLHMIEEDSPLVQIECANIVFGIHEEELAELLRKHYNRLTQDL